MSRRRAARRALPLLLLGLAAGCFEDRARPTPTEIVSPARLSVLLVAPRSGMTVPSGQEVIVTVLARDLESALLEGVGFVARRYTGPLSTIDSAAVRFAARADSTHNFTFRVPAEYATNTQIEVQGIGFGPAGQVRLSTASYVIAVRCVNGVCQ
ncbi:MAG TPA: hypothetical protein VK928_10410 [Longimicrobiales bacterium]|nr:hypothetical protein [Longimicrobiales bacterium]